MKVIAFTGMPFSGKSEAVKIAKEKNIPVLRMGDRIWEEVKKQGLDLNEKNVGRIADEMRKENGKDIWAKKTIKKIKTMEKPKLIVIDGVRNIEEVETFKNELGKNFHLIAVETSNHKRYKRAMNRGRIDDSLEIEKIKKRDQREIKWGLNQVIASADIIIKNEGSIEEFYKKVKEIFKTI